jgi:hypothetical protein
MAIRPKPQESPAADENAVRAFIEKGSSTAEKTDISASAGKLQRLQLRLTHELVERIDQLRKKRTVAPSRHDWFLEAILEKLERDRAGRTARDLNSSLGAS